MRRANGFTLVELLIALAIVAIITAFAVPSYQESVRKAKRAEGRSMLLDAAQRQEQHFTQHNRYATDIVTNNPSDIDSLFLEPSSENGHYQLTLAAGATTTTFTFTATPQAPHVDTLCGNLTLNHLGVKGVTGTGTPDECW